jgi:hypothetical protein
MTKLAMGRPGHAKTSPSSPLSAEAQSIQNNVVKKDDLLLWMKETGGSTAEDIAKRFINKLSGARVPESGAKVKSSLPSESNDRAKAAGTRHWIISSTVKVNKDSGLSF